MGYSTYTNPVHTEMYDKLHQDMDFLAVGPDGEAPQDARFYLDLIGKPPKNILDIGCGTGRVAIPLAKAGHHVTGIDVSAAMLNIAKRKIAELPADIQSRIKLVNTDWHDYNLNETFDAAVCPFTSFQRNLTIQEQDTWLQCVHKHLKPGIGKVIIDLFFPRLSRLADREELRHSNREFVIDGKQWIEHETVTRYPATQTFDVCLDYEPVDKTQPRIEHKFSLTWFMPREVERMLAANGFEDISILDGYSGELVHDDSNRMVVVGTRIK